jgi:hypothetical protein
MCDASSSKPCFSSHSLYPSTLDRLPPVTRGRRRLSYVEGLWSPELCAHALNRQAKADTNSAASISARKRRGPFSLERGLDSSYVFFKLSIILSFTAILGHKTTKATRLGRPRCESLSG